MASNVQDLEKQKEALEALLAFLHQFEDQLGMDMASYNRYVDRLLPYGVSKQTYDHYSEAFQAPLVARLTGIMSGIREHDYPYLRANIEKIEEAIKEARRGAGEY